MHGVHTGGQKHILGHPEWWTLDAQSEYWTPGANTGHLKSVLEVRSKYWTTGVVDTGCPDRILDTRSEYWTVTLGRPVNIGVTVISN